MPAKLRRLSGDDLIAIFSRLGFQIHSRRGSHIKLRKLSVTGEKQTLTIVAHKELDIGTLHAIFRQASRYIPEEKLNEYFYTE